jgi:L-ascorbate metabolism protein UlaG (beta-lactamase superfamily)
MELTYIGHSCFHIKGKKVSLVIDPYNPEMVGYKMPKQNCKILLNSHQHTDHSHNTQVNHEILIDKPGEYEIDDVYITGIQTAHDDKDGELRGQNIVFSIDIDGINIVHLGDLGHELNEKAVAKLGSVDVLLVPVGGHFTIDSFQASKLISTLEPKIVIPMHFKTEDSKITELADVNVFLHEMGEKNPEKADSLKLQSAPSNENIKILILNPNH